MRIDTVQCDGCGVWKLPRHKQWWKIWASGKGLMIEADVDLLPGIQGFDACGSACAAKRVAAFLAGAGAQTGARAD